MSRSTVAASFREVPLGERRSITSCAVSTLTERLGSDMAGLAIEDLFTGHYFTAVRLSDGSQGAAINFNNVVGPHARAYQSEEYDAELLRIARHDRLLLRHFQDERERTCLDRSVQMAILNALGGRYLAGRATPSGAVILDGQLDLFARLSPGDRVAMIGCTGNYSCREIGRADFLSRIDFSDFEYTGQFKQGIEALIRRWFHRPEIVVPSDGSQNEVICRGADVVVIISDTICTGTLDELLYWSRDAREILITGRSLAFDPEPLFAYGATGVCSQRILAPDLLGFLRSKARGGMKAFDDELVAKFQRIYCLPPP